MIDSNIGIPPANIAPDNDDLESNVVGPSILLVDDQPARLLTYEAILGDLRLDFVRALSGEEALKKLLKHEFAAIVLDVNMPGMDGFETARYIREHHRLKHTPIIFVTGVNVTELDQLRGYEVGAIDYISVPVVPEILRSKISLLVELYNRRAELTRLNRELDAARTRLEAERDAAIAAHDAIRKTTHAQVASTIDPPQTSPAAHTGLHHAQPDERNDAHWLAALLEGTADEVYFTAKDGHHTHANSAVMREFGHSNAEGVSVVEIIADLEVLRPDGSSTPATEAPPLRALQGEIIRDEAQLVRIPRSGELRHRLVNATPVRDQAGQIIGSVTVVRDVTAQLRIEAALRAREVRSSALLKLGDQFRALTSPADLAFAAAQLLGETLGVSRCGYGTIDPVNEAITIERDWNAPGIGSLAGVLNFRDYGTYIDELKRGETVICANTLSDPRTQSTADKLAGIQVRAFINMPIVEQGHIVALLYLNHDHPRNWPEEEMSFIRDVADRTRIAVERRRGEEAIAADLRDMQLLRDLAARLVIEGDTNRLLDEILGTALKITHADAGTIQLLEESTQELVLTVTAGLPPALIKHFERVNAKSATSCGKALSRGERTLVSFNVNVSDDPDGSLRLHREHGLLAAQSTPLVSRSGNLLGMFSTHWLTAHEISAREHRFLDLLARFAADMIQRSRDEQDLRQSEQRLRDEGKRKDAFLAVLAHELRNPLASLSAAGQLLGKTNLKPETAGLARDALQRQVFHMARLLDDLLDVARITNGIIKLQPGRVNLAETLRSAVEAVSPQIADKQHRLDLQLSDAPAFVEGDADRLNQIFINLLSNAVRYTPPGGQINVRLSVSAEQRAIISITDNGIGIAAAMLPTIYEMFSPASRSRGANSGLGIGLSIARSLVEMHGGNIEARSEGENRGSEFIVSLPTVMQSADVDQLPIAELEMQNIPSLRILIADDNADNALNLTMLLEQQGHEVRMALDGREGLDEAERFRPDLALLDIGMPHLDGYQVARAIRNTEWGKHITLVAISGWGQQRDIDDAYAAGFDKHLTKPARLVDVMTVMRTIDLFSK